ncbi:MAG TPA: zinc ribbon domain-containing protein [Candidatus Lokiarchaeia archaeon]|nr:zinc ribbon domain-containing protein [Candidatus Lokiarchaeia archaeon]
MESIQRVFSKVIKKLDLPTPVTPTKKEELNPRQEKDLTVYKDLLINNLVGEVQAWGGVYNEDQWKAGRLKLPEIIKELQLAGKEKEIKPYFETYAKVMRKFLDAYVAAKAEVKTMPFKTVYMVKVPKINETEKGLEINDKPVGFIAELPYQIERSCAYGEMKEKKPLFAPIIGSLDLNWTPPTDKTKEGEYIEDDSLQANLFEAMDKQTMINSVWRYENYGRKGEPVCDKLMDNQDLMVTMERIQSEVDSKEFKANASVCAIMYAIDDRTIVAVVDYEGVQKNAFEAIFKLCAYLEEVPRAAGAEGAGGAAPAGQGVVTGGASTQQLPTWTEEELAQQPQFTSQATNLPMWTEEELENRQDKFAGGGLNLPVWTEEELAELSKSSGAQGLNLPEWQEEGLTECPKCGYACQPDWTECPVCGAKLKGTAPATEKPAAKKAGQKPAAKPAGQKPAAKPAAKSSAQKPAAKPSPGKPAAKPAPSKPGKPAAKPAAKPARPPLKPLDDEEDSQE